MKSYPWRWRGFHGSLAGVVLGLATGSGPGVAAADFTASGLSTRLTDPPELRVENVVVRSEAPLADGRVRLEIDAEVRNLGDAIWENVSVSGRVEIAGIRVEPPESEIRHDGILAPGRVANLTQIPVTVAADQVAAVREAVLSGSGLTHAGAEMWIYVHPPKGIDAESEAAWRSPAEWTGAGPGEMRLVFTNSTAFLLALRVGDLLVENPSVHLLARTHAAAAEPVPDVLPVLADFVPFLVEEVTVSEEAIHVVGRKKRVLEVVRSATLVGTPLDAYVNPVRDPYKPDPEKTHTAVEQAMRREEAGIIATEESPRDGRLADLNGMFSRPWHFNEVAVGDRVTLSGELLFRQSGLRLEVKVEDFRIERVIAHIDAGVVFNLLIECGEPEEDTADDPADEGTITLFEIDDIPAVTFNLGGVPVSVKPVLRLTAGVEANIPSRLVLPLQSAFTVGMEMGYDRSLVTDTDDGYFHRPVTDFVPVRVSDPTVFDELAATVGFWTQLDVGLEIGVGAGVSVQSGPSLGIRLQNDYRLAPLEDPWWEVDLGLDLVGNFAIDLELLEFAEIRLLDATGSLHRFDLFHRDAGGPLLGGVRLAGAGPDSRFAPRIGGNVRWGRLFQSRPNFQGFRKAFAIGVPGSDGDVIVGGYNGYSLLARFSGDGELAWMKDTYPLPTVHRGAPVPDGTFFTAGTQGTSVVFAQYDGDGNRLWATTYTREPTFAVEAVAVGADDAGRPEFYVAGRVNHTTIRTSDPALIKLDGQGQVLWAMYYAHGDDDEALGMTVAADGHILLCGFAKEYVAPPAIGTPDPGNILKLALAGGMVMKVDSRTGAVLWATVCPARWGLSFNAIVEAPDGTIYAGGYSSRPVNLDRPSNVFARFSPDGTLLDHISVGDDPDWPDELPHSGRSPYDTVTGLKWTPDGLIACGRSGLGTRVTGWVIGLTEKLGVRFFSAVEGPGPTPFLDIADVGDGMAVLGQTQSPFALPGQVGQTIPMLLKLPWEGLMRFGANTGFRSLYLQPWTYHASATPEYQVLSSIVLPPTPRFPAGREVFFGHHHGPLTYDARVLTLTPEANGTGVNPAPAPTVLPVEFVPPFDLGDFESWAAYHHLPAENTAESDTDGDGLIDRFEAYFGRDPRIPETSPVFEVSLTDAGGTLTVVVAFNRATYARSWGVEIQTSEDLETWAPGMGVSEAIVTLDSRTERVFLSVPADAGGRRFFRAALSRIHAAGMGTRRRGAHGEKG